ncbi:hypothetical protein SAMN05192583_2239 [Sphingomonas gellani]|uniref:UrcA family protein n=1 Tax=Sphingomonas gellani TaxID=1166340 RepID=A0A1H8EMP5_9SPHN|nr:hypothetical protein [Sphingomonas gellani]SEN20851.1 hypothetical protein SAMN05192583_2239 [Sphingomonas gellani]
MFRPVLAPAVIALALLGTTGGAAAQQMPDQQAESGQPPKRIRDVTIKRGEPCPRSTSDEVVVCRTLEEPYRIPKALRDDRPVSAANQSWVNRAATMDEVGRVAGGLPDTCSPVGTGGQSGCALQRAKAYSAEKRANAAAASQVP